MHPRLCPYVERGVKGQVSYVRRRRLPRGVSATSSWERSTLRRALYWDSMESPVGPIYVALTEAGALALVMVGVSRMRFIEEIEKSGGQEAWDPKASAPVIRQLGEYFAGKRQVFDVSVDLEGLTSFQRAVLQATQQIPFGQVRTYGQVAAAVGKPKAARAVGRALGLNPVSVVIPCHRVIGADGGLHGYSGAGGLSTKRFLLELEGAPVRGSFDGLPARDIS